VILHGRRTTDDLLLFTPTMHPFISPALLFSFKSTSAADTSAAVALVQGLSASLPYGAAVAMPSSFQLSQQEGPAFPITARDAKWRALAVLTYLYHATTNPSKRLPAPDACHFPGNGSLFS
jgi:hypothetical protein